MNSDAMECECVGCWQGQRDLLLGDLNHLQRADSDLRSLLTQSTRLLKEAVEGFDEEEEERIDKPEGDEEPVTLIPGWIREVAAGVWRDAEEPSLADKLDRMHLAHEFMHQLEVATCINF